MDYSIPSVADFWNAGIDSASLDVNGGSEYMPSNYPVVAGGGASGISFDPGTTSTTYGAGDFLGTFDRIANAGLSLAGKYSDLSIAASNAQTQRELAKVQGNTAVALAERQYKQAQQPFWTSPNLAQLQNKVGGVDAIMIITAIVGAGIALMSMKK